MNKGKNKNMILIKLNPIMPRNYNMRKRIALREFEKSYLEKGDKNVVIDFLNMNKENDDKILKLKK